MHGIQHYNVTSRVSGYFLAWGMLVVAVLLLNRDSLSWEDPLTVSNLVSAQLAQFVVSIAAYMLFARPWVTTCADAATVRNPCKVYFVPYANITELTEGVGGYTSIKLIDGSKIRVWALERSGWQRIMGNLRAVSHLYLAWQEWCAANSEKAPNESTLVGDPPRVAVLDFGVSTLLIAWTVYAASVLAGVSIF